MAGGAAADVVSLIFTMTGSTSKNLFGFLAGLSILIMVVTSLEVIRRKNFEVYVSSSSFRES